MKNNLIQLNYRYASKEYINQNLGASANRYQQDIKQVGVVAAWEVSDNWALVGKYYQDIALKNRLSNMWACNITRAVGL